MKYIQWLSKGMARYPLFFIEVTAILACAWLPSTVLAVGIGSAGSAATNPVVKVGSDSSKVTAPTNASPKKYSCGVNTNSSQITKVVVPCSLANNVQNNNDYACPAGQVVVGNGTVDNGTYSPPAHFYNCNIVVMNDSVAAFGGSRTAAQCEGNSNYNYIYTYTYFWGASPTYCRDWGCSWGGAVWVSNPSCYVKCAPQTSCQWQ